MQQSDSSLIGKEPCPKCGSRNNLARYSDGHAHCFTPGCNHWEKGDHATTANTKGSTRRMAKDLIEPGSARAIQSRKLTEETCRKFGYTITKLPDGRTVHVAPYYDKDRNLIGQKIRPHEDKDGMFVSGSLKGAMLFGQQLWGGGGKKVVITEGEIDCLSVSQMQGNKWPTVSVPNGAQGAANAIRKNIEWLEAFEQVIFMFDMDEHGKRATEECVELLSPGKAFVAALPHKDPNECLQKGAGEAIISAIWQAKAWRPEGIISINDIADKATKPIPMGKPWFLDKMTKWTFGRRPGELYGFGAGTGVGKTDFFTSQIEFDVNTLKEKVAIFFLEQHPVETVQRLAGKFMGRPFHVPDGSWEPHELAEAVEHMRCEDMVRLYHHFGATDWEVLKRRMRSVAQMDGIKHFYLDHLTALADPSNERESLETIMAELAGFAQELGLFMHYISHLSTPEKGSHEEGAKVQLRHFKGSRAIGFWTHFAFGLERNKNAEDPEERKITTLRCVKDRYTGRADGETLFLQYDPKTTKLHEVEKVRAAVEDYGFGNEEAGDHATL